MASSPDIDIDIDVTQIYRQQRISLGCLEGSYIHDQTVCIHFMYLAIATSLMPKLNFSLFKGRDPSRFQWESWVSLPANFIRSAREYRKHLAGSENLQSGRPCDMAL